MAIVKLNPVTTHLESDIPTNKKSTELRVAINEVKIQVLKEKIAVEIDALTKKIGVLMKTFDEKIATVNKKESENGTQ